MSPHISKILQVLNHPLSRGMVSYAVIWPFGSLLQQTIVDDEKYDFVKAGRYCVYGSCYVAPTLFCWFKFANQMFPQNNLRSVLLKVVLEQTTFTPFAMSSFYFGMTLLEGKSIEEAKEEVKAKFLPTYKIGLCIWPALQVFNYLVIKERNRVVFASCCSLLWTTLLAYLKNLDAKQVSSS